MMMGKRADDTDATKPEGARFEKSPYRLIRDAAGDRRAMAQKATRLAQALAAYVDTGALDARLERLRTLGYIDRVPNRVQLIAGSIDMMRFWIVPAADDYYRSKGINFHFHQLLRFLDEPASLVDPTGFLSSADNIIGHVMQVVHANPRYDLQLLESHEGGLAELESQVVAMLDGTHPRAASIGAIVEEPDYHGRLLEYVRAYRKERTATDPLRENITGSRFDEIEKTFGSLPGAMGYFASLPERPLAAALHLLRTREFSPRAVS